MTYEDYFKETEQYRHQVEIIDAILEEQKQRKYFATPQERQLFENQYNLQKGDK